VKIQLLTVADWNQKFRLTGRPRQHVQCQWAVAVACLSCSQPA